MASFLVSRRRRNHSGAPQKASDAPFYSRTPPQRPLRRSLFSRTDYDCVVVAFLALVLLLGIFERLEPIQPHRLIWLLQQQTKMAPLPKQSFRRHPSFVHLTDESLVLFPVRGPKSLFSQGLPELFHQLDPDYNGLFFKGSFGRPVFDRVIDHSDHKNYNHQRRTFLYSIDEYLRRVYSAYEDREFTPNDCRPPAWIYRMYPNCNAFHELILHESKYVPLQEYSVRYLAHGYYREGYRFRNKFWERQQRQKRNERMEWPESQQFVLKHLRFHDDFPFNIKNQHAIVREAVILERLSGSPHITNVYGYCATSTLVQAGGEVRDLVLPQLSWQSHQGRATREQLDAHPDPINTLLPAEKLHFALSIAQSLAELHGFVGGAISHDDVSLDQWMIAPDGRIFMNDINNAIVLPWKESTQEYCPYDLHYPYGDLRPAEAYIGNGTATESVDIWCFGNIVLSILSGLYPFYTSDDEKANQKLILRGQVPSLDLKYNDTSQVSYTEQRLYQLLPHCFQMKPEDRWNIFQVVEYLKETERIVNEQDAAATRVGRRKP